jgi:hypothetical protein
MSLNKPLLTASQAEVHPSRNPFPYSVLAGGKFLTPVNGRGFAPHCQAFGIDSANKLQEPKRNNKPNKKNFFFT